MPAERFAWPVVEFGRDRVGRTETPANINSCGRFRLDVDTQLDLTTATS